MQLRFRATDGSDNTTVEAAVDDIRVLAEVRAFHALGLDADLPAMKAVGLRELLAHVAGTRDLDAAVAGAKQASRRYAKRQMTWQRNKMHSWHGVFAQQSECFFDKIIPIVSQFLLTDPV